METHGNKIIRKTPKLDGRMMLKMIWIPRKIYNWKDCIQDRHKLSMDEVVEPEEEKEEEEEEEEEEGERDLIL